MVLCFVGEEDGNLRGPFYRWTILRLHDAEVTSLGERLAPSHSTTPSGAMVDYSVKNLRELPTQSQMVEGSGRSVPECSQMRRSR